MPSTDKLDKLLKVDNLTTRFDISGGFFSGVKGRVHAVEDVSFYINFSETLSLVGESAGKSTTDVLYLDLFQLIKEKFYLRIKTLQI